MSFKQLNRKIINPQDLVALSNELKTAGKTTVFTNGCFDLIHLGHIDYLSKAKALGDVLVVGVNSDDSVKCLEKGSARPIKDEQQRLTVMAAFEFVDFVLLFDDDTPINLINNLKPNVLVKGGDYNPNQTDALAKDYIVGSQEMKSINHRVEVIPFVPGYSTSELERKIISANKR